MAELITLLSLYIPLPWLTTSNTFILIEDSQKRTACTSLPILFLASVLLLVIPLA